MTYDASTPTTPIRGNESGEGWHFNPPRRKAGAALVAVVDVALVVGAVAALLQGSWVVAALCVVLAVVLAAIPLANRQGTLEPRLVEGEHGSGLLLPIHGMKPIVVFMCLALGLPLISAPVVTAFVAFRDVAWWLGALRMLASVIPFAFGLLFMGGAVGGMIGSRRRDKGILLTEQHLVLTTQVQPMQMPWEAVHGVRPHWNRFRPPGNAFRTPDDSIHNWLSFPAESTLVAGPNPLRVMAKTDEPTVDAEKLAMRPDLVLAALRFYLAEPEARRELRTTACLDRLATLERTLPVS